MLHDTNQNPSRAGRDLPMTNGWKTHPWGNKNRPLRTKHATKPSLPPAPCVNTRHQDEGFKTCPPVVQADGFAVVDLGDDLAHLLREKGRGRLLQRTFDGRNYHHRETKMDKRGRQAATMLTQCQQPAVHPPFLFSHPSPPAIASIRAFNGSWMRSRWAWDGAG